MAGTFNPNRGSGGASHKQFQMTSSAVPVDRQKEKIHGGHPGARVDFGGDKEPAGGSRGVVQDHTHAVAIHAAKGKGMNVIDTRVPNVTDGRDDRMNCPDPDGDGPY